MEKIALLDTNIVIHRETMNTHEDGIGVLFRRLDQLGYVKSIHHVTYDELMRYEDYIIRKAMEIKSRSYNLIQNTTPICDDRITTILSRDKTPNDINDTTLLNEVLSNRVDILISEDKGILRKADCLNLSDRVYSIDGFLESTEYLSESQVGYNVLSISHLPFSTLNIDDPFFDSFKKEYCGFQKWFLRKSEEKAYVYKSGDSIIGFLYLKIESEEERYPDITPSFKSKRRLKIGTFKVDFNGLKLGERYIKIIFDNALKKCVDEIYVTMFDVTAGQKGLQILLEKFGFVRHGIKSSSSGDEIVMVRTIELSSQDKSFPTRYFPFLSRSCQPNLAPIHIDYHSKLFPDDQPYRRKVIFTGEDAYRYALIKTYISWGAYRSIQVSDILLFYMCGAGYPAKYTSNISSYGIVTRVFDDVKTLEQLKRITNGKTAYTDIELQLSFAKKRYPLVVEFAYCGSLKKRPNREVLLQMGVLTDQVNGPRCITPIKFEKLEEIVKWSGNDTSIIIN